MQNVKFKCVPINNQTILSSTAFTIAQYTVPLEQEICENT